LTVSRRGLGRGLSALIPNASQESQTNGDLHELAIELIAPNPDQPRTDISEEGVAELADSIGKVGLLQPIIVRPLGDAYQIIAGERRWRAARLCGLERVPVKVLSTTEVESLEIALIENLQRQDLNAIEEARGYRRLLTEYSMTQAELADKVSKSRSAITNSLRLLDLPDDVQELVYENRMSAGHARAVLSVPDEGMRLKLAQKVVDDGLSVRDAENLARLYAAGQGERAARPTTPKSFKAVARRLRRLLATNVRVKIAKDKGKIEIEFQNEDDLERIVGLLVQPGPTDLAEEVPE
jgi:ParB family transcriptional regulator, chromosome partitioning protein